MIPSSLKPIRHALPASLRSLSLEPYEFTGSPGGESYSLQNYCRSLQPGCPHARARGSHRKRECSRRSRRDEHGLAAQRTDERSLAAGEFPLARAGCLLSTIGEWHVRHRAATVCRRGRLEIAHVASDSYSCYDAACAIVFRQVATITLAFLPPAHPWGRPERAP